MSPLPTVSEIQNRISYHCQKPSKQTNDEAPDDAGEAPNAARTQIITVGDVINWADNYQFESELDDDKPFVIDIKASSYEEKEKHFQYVFSTKKLLRNASKYKTICVDATYKVVYNGFPLLIMGSIDANRRFHLIAASLCVSETTTDFKFFFEAVKKGVALIGHSLETKVLISDAAPSIMNAFNDSFESAERNVVCWAHVKRNLFQKTKDLDMLADIDKLQLSPNENTFEKGVAHFFDKWSDSEPRFCRYFRPHTSV